MAFIREGTLPEARSRALVRKKESIAVRNAGNKEWVLGPKSKPPQLGNDTPMRHRETDRCEKKHARPSE